MLWNEWGIGSTGVPSGTLYHRTQYSSSLLAQGRILRQPHTRRSVTTIPQGSMGNPSRAPFWAAGEKTPDCRAWPPASR